MKKIYLLLLLSSTALGATPNRTLWQEWYLYTVDGVAQGYFEETMESRPAEKNLALTQRWVEKENGRTETYIGSVAMDDQKLTPVAFFSERTGPNEAYKIDGRAKSGNLRMNFTAVKPKGQPQKKAVKIHAGLILSNFVPLLLARHDSTKGPLLFSAVVEDARDGKFDSRDGRAELATTTKDIKGQKCRLAAVEFNGIAGEWWFTTEGKLCRLELPSAKSKLELTTEAEAKKAL